jgi:HD-like signal output (HDOD) protein
MRLLFVADDPRALEALQSRLWSRRREWDLVFTSDAADALERMSRAPFDLIVTDLRAPEIEGQTLLRAVQDKYPRAVRLALVDEVDPAGARAALRVAHQVLPRDCDPVLLQETIERTARVSQFVRADRLRALITRPAQLPTLPRVYTQLIQVLDQPSASLDDVAAVLERDVAVSAKLLKVVNSPFFRVFEPVVSVQKAVAYLGTDITVNLVLSLELFGQAASGSPRQEQLAGAIQKHALLTARIISRVVGEKASQDGAFTAAILHDVGMLVLLTQAPREYQQILDDARGGQQPLHRVEAERLGATHAEVGAYLLGLWGLPFSIIEAVADHHDPAAAAHTRFGMTDALHVANALASRWLPVHPDTSDTKVDIMHLATLGRAARMADWESAAAELGGAVSAGA